MEDRIALLTSKSFTKLKMTDRDHYVFLLSVIGSNQLLKNQFVSALTGKDPSVYLNTIGMDISTFSIETENAGFKFCLFNGINKRYIQQHYYDSYGCILLFDKSNRCSFEAIPNLLQEFHKARKGRIILGEVNILVGLLVGSDAVSFDEGNALAKRLDLRYFETPVSIPLYQSRKIFSYISNKLLTAYS